MKKVKPKMYTKTKNIISDSADNKNYLIHYMLLKF